MDLMKSNMKLGLAKAKMLNKVFVNHKYLPNK